MQIAQPAASRLASGEWMLSSTLKAADYSREVFYRTNASLDSIGVEPFVCVSVIPAMKSDEDIRCAAPVSARLAGRLSRIQSTFAEWYTDLRAVKLDAPTHPLMPPATHRGVGCFFSGGVDSFFSLAQHADEVDTLIFVHGFDIPLANTALRDRVSKALRDAAAALGKRLIEVETNAREWLDPFGNWGTHTHGSALVSVANLLAGVVRKVYLPSSHTRDDLMPWGSHPAVDGFWGTELMEIAHDDDDVTRFDKTAAIAKSDIVLSHLRVCWENRDNAYNCGQCEKCLRTMMTLRVLGALDRCRTFATPLDLNRVARLTSVRSIARRRFYTDIAAAAEKAGDRAIVRAIEQALAPKSERHWLLKKAGKLRRTLIGR